MLLALDIGNSSISVGVFDFSDLSVCSDKTRRIVSPECLVHRFKISAKGLSADEYALQMYNLLRLGDISPSRESRYFMGLQTCTDTVDPKRQVHHAVIASVVPSMTDVLAKATEYLTGQPPFVICAGVKTGFGIHIKHPEQLGADIVANAAYAVDMADASPVSVGSMNAPVVILDVGTATTLTVIDKCRNLLGTIIMPGLRVSLQALSGSAAQLSDIPLAPSDVLIGRDSSESVRSGVVNGHCIIIDGFLRNIREQFAAQGEHEKLSLVATGGLAHIILPHMRNQFTYLESLTLLGEAKIFLLNQRSCYKTL